MFRKFLPLLLVIVLVLMITGGCESYKKFGPIAGGDANAIVINNGGLAVLQGDYLYFINGHSGYNAEEPSANFFGNVVKGAVMRGKLTESGLSEVEIVVPKKVMASSPNTGIYVFGEWIYYVSPGTGTDNRGNVLTDYIDFMRTKIDGTKTQRITTVKGNTTQFKFTPDALMYYQDNKLFSIDLTAKRFKAQEVDEEIVSILFPNNPIYNPASPTSPADYVFYTKKAESELDQNNIVYVVNANGTGREVLIDKSTYTANAEDLTNIFTISLMNTSLEDGKLNLYYTKKTVATIEKQDRGLYSYEFSSVLTIDPAKEVRYTLTNPTKVTPIGNDKAVLIQDSEDRAIYKPMEAGDIIPNKVSYGFAADITLFGIVNLNDKDYMIYRADNKIHRFPIDKSENAAVLFDSKIHAWIAPDIINQYMFYVLDDEFQYTHMVDLSTFDITDKEALFNEMIGKMSDEDIELKEEMESEDND